MQLNGYERGVVVVELNYLVFILYYRWMMMMIFFSDKNNKIDSLPIMRKFYATTIVIIFLY